MSDDPPEGEVDDADLVRLQALVRRVVGARVRDPDTVDDLIQETLARVLAARGRLEGEALAPYAVVTARNLVHSSGREEDRRRRHRHRLVESETAPPPEDELLHEEETAALAVAWSRLPAQERRDLASHHIDKVDLALLAEESSSTRGAVAVRLARARARLRLEYVLALRRVELPTALCRSVLLAISSGDRRRQEALAAGGHLLHCECCASLSAPLLTRSRSLAVLWPLVVVWRLGALVGRAVARAGRWVRSHPIHATGAGTGVAVAAVAVVMLSRPDTGWLRSTGQSLLPPPPASQLAAHATRPVDARSVTVQSVAPPTGFWVGTSQRSRLFVELLGTPPFHLIVGDKVSFVGYLDPNHEGSIERFGLGGQDAAQLRDQGHHIHVEARALRRD